MVYHPLYYIIVARMIQISFNSHVHFTLYPCLDIMVLGKNIPFAKATNNFSANGCYTTITTVHQSLSLGN